PRGPSLRATSARCAASGAIDSRRVDGSRYRVALFAVLAADAFGANTNPIQREPPAPPVPIPEDPQDSVANPSVAAFAAPFVASGDLGIGTEHRLRDESSVGKDAHEAREVKSGVIVGAVRVEVGSP